MAQPKRKHSKSRTGKRRSTHKLALPKLVECPRCHQLMKPHHVCPTCGYYAGKEVVEVEEI
ncbi:MAG: 50S ribosomal protein L32 [bacterium]